MKKLLAGAIAGVLLLAACSLPQQQASIAALEVGLATAETAATSYVALPRCLANASGLCSDADLVAKIAAADMAAYTSLKSAEAIAASGGSPDLTAATIALTALQSIIATLPKPPAPGV